MESQKKNVFVVHGHDKRALKEIEEIINKDLNANPVILKSLSGQSWSLIEKLERATKNISFGIAILTPDDEGRKIKDTELKPRVRQNVLFELGYLYALIGRDKVLSLLKKEVDIPTDILGVNREQFQKSVYEQIEKVIDAFETACNIQKPESIIKFDYKPHKNTDKAWLKLLEKNDWHVVLEGNEKVYPKFKSISDMYQGRVLNISATHIHQYYMQRQASTIESNCGYVEFVVKKDNPVLYCNVHVRKNNSQEKDNKWLNIKAGPGTSTPVRSDPEHEWQVYVPHRDLSGDWKVLQVNLPQHVHEAFGKNGWVFNQLHAFRIRGNITIAKIKVYRQ